MEPCCSHHILQTMMQSIPFLSVGLLAIYRYVKKFDQLLILKPFRKTKTVD